MSRTRTHTVVCVASAMALMLAGMALTSPVQADTSPPPGVPATVSADPLPTVQVDGVVWSQVVVGSKVYVAGSFTAARPAGSAPGVNTVARANLLAYDIRTGVLDPSFAPVLNAQALAIAAAPDGSRIYVAGSFTTVNGSSRSRIAAFSTSNGALVSTFRPTASTTVRSVAANNSTVYFGGDFTTVTGVARPFVAAADASTGAVLPWNPAADAPVNAITLNYSGSKVVLGGRFTAVGGLTGIRGLAAVDPVTGLSAGWAATATIRNSGTQGAITSLTADADGVYGTGYTFGRDAGNLEGTFMADNDSGAVTWVEDCHGDTYSAYPMGEVVYKVGHAHFCGNVVNGFMQTDPWTYKHSMGFTKQVAGTLTREYQGYFNWEGTPSPRALQWFPDWTVGSYTGQSQAGWSITGDGTYVTVGGEFPSVNGVAQQGLVRFAVTRVAPKKVGPDGNNYLTPSVVSYKSGGVRVGWLGTHDRDNEALTYKVFRNFKAVTDTPVYEVTATSRFDRRQPMSFVDRTAVPGTQYNYRVYVYDPDGNYTSRGAGIVTTSNGSVQTPYQRAVLDDGPSAFYRLGDAAGATTLVDTASADNAVPQTGVTLGAAGAIGSEPGTGATFDGSTTGFASAQLHRPAPNVFSVEAWFKTTTNRGGKIVGYGEQSTGSSSSSWNDRHIYMDNAGRLFFGTYATSRATINSTSSYNDGSWHHVVATLGSGGMRLYVDGASVASRSDITTGRTFTGMWRIGGDNLSNWPSRPTSSFFAGSIDEVAIYPSVLTAQQVAGHHAASTGEGNQLPTAEFDHSVNLRTVTFDGSASDDPDGTIATYTWNFGDGSPADSGVSPVHEYATDGTYPVTLTVTDDDGGTDSVTHEVVAVNPTPNQDPTAAFTFTVNAVAVSFDGTTSSDPDGSIAGYSWDFGDGATATGATPSHTYAFPGTRAVTLTVTDDDGATDAVTQDVVVAVQPPPDPGGGVIPLPPPAPVVMTPAPSARPSVAVKVKARSGKSKLYVNVNPNKGKGYWSFQVQKQQADGSWKALKTYRTKGSKETRTLNFKKGTYRVIVKAKYGYLGTTSAEVYLRK